MNTQKSYLNFNDISESFISKKEGILQRKDIEEINSIKGFNIKLVPPNCFNSNFDDNRWLSRAYNKSRGEEYLNFESISSEWRHFLKLLLCALEQVPTYGDKCIISFGTYQNYFFSFKYFFNYISSKNINSLSDVTEEDLRELFLNYSQGKTKVKNKSFLQNIQKLFEYGPSSYQILNDGLKFNPIIDYYILGTAKNSKDVGETEILEEEIAKKILTEAINWVENKFEDVKAIIELSKILKNKKEEISQKNKREKHKSLTVVQAKQALSDDNAYSILKTVRESFGKDLITFLENGHQNSANGATPELVDFMKILLIYKKVFAIYQSAVYVICASFTGWRASEIFSIKLENLKETAEGFELGTLLIKTTTNKNELIYRPIPPIVAKAIRNLYEINQFADGLIENKMVKVNVDKSIIFKTSLGNPSNLKSLNEDLKSFGEYIVGNKFNISTHQFRRFFAHFYIRRYKGNADAIRWNFRHISKDMILHYTSQALNAKQLSLSKKELANEISNHILKNNEYKALSVENRLSEIKMEAKVLTLDEASKYIQDKLEKEIVNLHAMEWGYCLFQANNKGAVCEAKNGPIESRAEPSTCGKCKFLCTGKEHIEFWQQTILLHQDITQNKFATKIMKDESNKLVQIGYNILNRHNEQE